MTISSTATRKAGPYAGKRFHRRLRLHLQGVRRLRSRRHAHTDDTGLETVKTLTTHYTATLNANQNSTGRHCHDADGAGNSEADHHQCGCPRRRYVNLSDGGGSSSRPWSTTPWTD